LPRASFGTAGFPLHDAEEAALRKHYLIETDELANLIKQNPKNLRILNATWYMPGAPNNALQEHRNQRLT